MLHKQTALNPRALVHEARKSRAQNGVEREKEVVNLAQYIHDTIQVFDPKLRGRITRSGFNATVLYLSMKLLYVLNAVGQLIMLNYFLGGNYFSWGYTTLMDVVRGQDWEESEIFPRVIMLVFMGFFLSKSGVLGVTLLSAVLQTINVSQCNVF
jgi:hypothetical protein